jgi:hypothetical protein
MKTSGVTLQLLEPRLILSCSYSSAPRPTELDRWFIALLFPTLLTTLSLHDNLFLSSQPNTGARNTFNSMVALSAQALAPRHDGCT